ncbi:MAG: HD domain-containing protein [Clostridia bacterium]|nr:HD domain-containing protein [Clostridia bacterium]
MKQYVVAMCMPDDSKINKRILTEMIRNTFYTNDEKVKNVICVILIDYDDLEGAERYGSGTDLQLSTLKYIDTFVFTPETLRNKKYREMLIKALNLNSRQIKHNHNRKLGIDFVNLVHDEDSSNETKLAMEILYDSYPETSLFSWNYRNITGNFIGSANSKSQAKQVIATTEKTTLDIVNEMINSFRSTGNEYTLEHVSSVTKIAEEIGVEMGKSKDEIEIIKLAALLHDYGKLYIPSQIINKPARLTKEEYRIMKNHAVLGALELGLNRENSLLDSAIEACVEHHERPDGTGYPLGLKDTQIGQVSKIISVADAMHAMLGRTYESPKTLKEIIHEIHRCSSKDENGMQQFDKEVSKALLNILVDSERCKNVGLFWNDENDVVRYEVPSIESLGFNNNIETNSNPLNQQVR